MTFPDVKFRVILKINTRCTMSCSNVPPQIAPKAHACFGRFNELCRLLTESDRSARPILVDQLGRFKIWAGNIGAFQELPTPSSLDYRLSEAPKVALQVAKLLDDLDKTLQEGIKSTDLSQILLISVVLSIISGDRPNRVSSSIDAGTDYGVSTGNVDETASVSSDQSQPSSELEELLWCLGDTVTSLFRISVFIQRVTSRDRHAKITKAQGEPFDAQFDIDHVGGKFPLLRKTDWLEQRMGKAITQRRQYLRYCRQQHDKLHTQPKSTNTFEDATENQKRPAGTKERGERSSQAAKSQSQSIKAPSTHAVATVFTSRINDLDSLKDLSDEAHSETSSVTSTNEHHNSGKFRLPSLPEEAVECPYCVDPQLIKNRQAWK